MIKGKNYQNINKVFISLQQSNKSNLIDEQLKRYQQKLTKRKNTRKFISDNFSKTQKHYELQKLTLSNQFKITKCILQNDQSTIKTLEMIIQDEKVNNLSLKQENQKLRNQLFQIRSVNIQLYQTNNLVRKLEQQIQDKIKYAQNIQKQNINLKQSFTQSQKSLIQSIQQLTNQNIMLRQIDQLKNNQIKQLCNYINCRQFKSHQQNEKQQLKPNNLKWFEQKMEYQYKINSLLNKIEQIQQKSNIQNNKSNIQNNHSNKCKQKTFHNVFTNTDKCKQKTLHNVFTNTDKIQQQKQPQQKLDYSKQIIGLKQQLQDLTMNMILLQQQLKNSKSNMKSK